MILCSTKVEERRKVNKRAEYYKRKTAWLFIWEYTAELKVPEGLNLRKDIIGCI